MMPYDDASTEAQPVRRLEVFTGAGRRRRWSDADRAAIVAESYSNVGTVSDVARRHGLASGQLFSWRRQVRQPVVEAASPAAAAMFVPALVEALPEPADLAPTPRRVTKRPRKSRAAPVVEVIIDGASVKIARGADAATIAAVLGALKTPR
ncbi:MAG: IS66-like element accessory protein TnpA [Janthinobacterium lividum]